MNKNIEKKYWCILAAVVFLIALAAITNGSMWDDELCRVEESINGDFAGNWIKAVGYGQPGYMLWMFFWIKFVGKTEFLLRTSNLVFAAAAFFYVYKIIKSKGCSPLFALLFFIHPMFIYYMDEVTPYIAVYAFSIAFIYYVFYAEPFDGIKNMVTINFVFLAGVFTHFIFGFIYVLYLYKILSAKYRKKFWEHFRIFAIFCIAYIPLFVLDCYGLFLLGPTTRTGFGIKNMMYVCYAFLGFAGLGISRNDLRAGHFEAMGIPELTGVGILAVILIGIAVVWFMDRKKIKFSSTEMIKGAILYFAVFCTFSVLLDFGMWERHCIGVFPVFLIVMIDLFEYFLCRKSLGKVFVWGYCICLLFSAWNIRFSYYYACDDWKSVSEYLVNELEQNEKITIITSMNGSSYFDAGKYYDITENKKKKQQKIINLKNEQELKEMITIQEREDKFIFVLFEKAVSPEMFRFYDEHPDFYVDDTFNSFKIVEYTRGSV